MAQPTKRMQIHIDEFVTKTTRAPRPKRKERTQVCLKQVTLHWLKRVTVVETILRLKEELTECGCDVKKTRSVLGALEKEHVHTQILKDTEIGQTLNKCRSAWRESTKAGGPNENIKEWKKVFNINVFSLFAANPGLINSVLGMVGFEVKSIFCGNVLDFSTDSRAQRAV